MAKKILLTKGSTIKVQVKIKAKDYSKVPDWGLGTGVLAEQEFTIEEDVTKENKVRFYLKRDEIYQQLLDETLEPTFTIKE
jgi:hypothetical protein